MWLAFVYAMPESLPYSPLSPAARRQLLGQRDTVSGGAVTALVVVIVVGALGLGFWQFGQSVRSPFKIAAAPATNAQDTSSASLVDLRARDTDGDGLSDFDEQVIHQTSIYLEDTDSDGISDADEVAQGKNPLCPEGKTCTVGTFGETATDVDTAAATTPQPDVFEKLASGAYSVDMSAAQAAAQVTPEIIRSALVGAGVSADVVQQYSDQELLDWYAQAAAEQQTTVQTNLNQLQGSSEVSKTDFATAAQSMTGEQIRQLLRESGVSQEVLDRSSDEMLRQFLLDSLQSNQ